jgi:hypothetical protein
LIRDHRDADEADVVRRLAWLLLTIGLVALCIADAAIAVEQTVMTPDRLRAAAPGVLATGPVRREMTRRVANELQRQLPGAQGLAQDRLDALAGAALREPRFVDAFADALVDLDGHVFQGHRGPVVLDDAAVTAAVRDAAASTTPELAASFAPGTRLTVSLETANAPDLHTLAGVVKSTARTALVVGLVLVVVGIEFAPRRRRAVARVGRWAIVLGSLHLVLFGLVARYVLAAFGAWPDVAAALIRGASARALIVGTLLVAGGAVAVGAVHRIDTAARRRSRAAALQELSRRTSWSPPPRERSQSTTGRRMMR